MARRVLSIAFLLGLLGLLLLPAAGQGLDPSLFAGLQWRQIGPFRSGNVYSVAGIAGDPTVYYAGLPEGGVWKTTDGGTVWRPIFDQEGVPAVGAVAVAPSAPNVVYVGTGDPTVWSFTPGQGMFKSIDGGAKWERIGLADTAYIPAVLVDPHDANVVLAGALGPRAGGEAAAGARGVFRSSNGGQAWQQTFAAAGVADMAWDQDDPAVAYIVVQRAGGVTQRAGGAVGAAATALVYKSTDEGASWQPLGLAGLPAGARSANIAVAAGTHGQRVYLLVGGLPGGRAAGVYRSDDGGATWRLGTEQIGSAGGRIYADPVNPDVVYLMGTAMYRSTDGAHSFAAFKGSPGGDDYRDLWIDPSNPKRILAGVDQGPTISVDGGRTWTPWYHLPNGQFYDVFTDNQFPYWVYGAQQDSGTAAVPSRGDFGDIRASDWYPVGGFEAGYIAVDPLNPRWIYTQGWYHAMRRFDRATGQVAAVFTPAPDDRFASMPPTLFAPTNPHRLYMAAQHVMASDDGGRTWIQLGGDLTLRNQTSPDDRSAAPASSHRTAPSRGAAIQSLAPSPVEGAVIWAGTTNGVVQLSRDGGHAWRDVSPPALTPRSAVAHIDASHASAGTAYLAVEDTGSSAPLLFRTSDYGASWQAIDAGLDPQYRTRVVREDPQDPDLLYAGTEMGVWVSFDRGAAWQPLQLNLPHTVVSDLQVHGDDLAISTYGRALWILDDVTPLRQARQALAAAGVYLYRPETAMRVRWSNNQDTPLPPEVPAGENPPEGAIIDYYLPAAASGPMTLAVRDAAGREVRSYTNTAPPPDLSPPNVPEYWFGPPATLATGAGMHRFVWDLRYPLPDALTYGYYGNLLDYTEYTLTWHAILGHTPREQPVGPLALPGVYTLALTVDGKTTTRPLTVKNDPRSAITQAGLEAQLAVEQRVVAGLKTSAEAYRQITAQRKALAEAAAHGGALAAAAQALEAKLAPLAAGTGASGFGVANRDLGRRLQDLDFGDDAPNASLIAAVHASCGQITDAAAALRGIEQTDAPAVNRLLAEANLAPLPTAAAASGPPCGR